MNPRDVTFCSESNPKAAKVANRKAKVKQLMDAGHTKKAAQRMVKEMKWMSAKW
ncbi:hypothetical protein CHO22_003602 [Escherichia coli]|nr:hypothetical protein [Escherichia coli]